MSAIGYKNHKVLTRMLTKAWHPKAIELLVWLTFSVHTEAGHNLIVTSAWRPTRIHSNDSGIHTTIPLRAFDLRSHRWVEDEDDGHYESIFGVLPERIRDAVNHCWQYDKYRPHLKVCVFHDTGKGWHLHMQVHPNTTLVKSLTCEEFSNGQT